MNCWPGCIAVIVGGRFQQNIGKPVEVLDTEHAEPGEWRVCSLAHMFGEVSPSRFAWKPAGTIGWADDRNLRPITPPAGTVSEDEVADLFTPDELAFVTTGERG